MYTLAVSASFFHSSPRPSAAKADDRAVANNSFACRHSDSFSSSLARSAWFKRRTKRVRRQASVRVREDDLSGFVCNRQLLLLLVLRLKITLFSLSLVANIWYIWTLCGLLLNGPDIYKIGLILLIFLDKILLFWHRRQDLSRPESCLFIYLCIPCFLRHQPSPYTLHITISAARAV